VSIGWRDPATGAGEAGFLRGDVAPADFAMLDSGERIRVWGEGPTEFPLGWRTGRQRADRQIVVSALGRRRRSDDPRTPV